MSYGSGGDRYRTLPYRPEGSTSAYSGHSAAVVVAPIVLASLCPLLLLCRCSATAPGRARLRDAALSWLETLDN
jgi:hypothetical protein